MNVLMLVVDSLRADRVLDGARTCRTPNLDDFRRSATAFTSAYSVASMTTVCTASILTGTYPFVHGVHSLAGRRLGRELPTLPEVFKAGGFHTWAAMTGPLEAVTGLDRGFDEYSCREYTRWLDTPFGDELVARLRSDRGRPWFGYVHLWEVHYPRRVTGRYRRPAYGRTLYDRAVSSLDEQLARVLDAVSDDTVVVVTADHGEYLAQSRKDELVTRLKGPTAWLKRNVPAVKKLKRRVMPLLFGDRRGGAPTDTESYRAWLGHGFHVHDSLVHVPLLVRGPGFPAGAEISSLASHIDLFPTLASALELDGGTPSQPGALDLTRVVGNGGATSRSAIYLQASGARRMNLPERWLAAIRTDRHKYVRGMFNADLPEELYDLERDPEERENLALELSDVAADLRGRLEGLIQTGVSAEADEGTAYTPEEQALLERRLQDLGYLD
ncbi:MAG: sulfatase-like hydrolase/transferase [Gaiellaceae bacterium]